MEIKLKAYTTERLQTLIHFYEQFGYELILIRPGGFWEPAAHIAVMRLIKESK